MIADGTKRCCKSPRPQERYTLVHFPTKVPKGCVPMHAGSKMITQAAIQSITSRLRFLLYQATGCPPPCSGWVFSFVQSRRLVYIFWWTRHENRGGAFAYCCTRTRIGCLNLHPTKLPRHTYLRTVPAVSMILVVSFFL